MRYVKHLLLNSVLLIGPALNASSPGDIEHGYNNCQHTTAFNQAAPVADCKNSAASSANSALTSVDISSDQIHSNTVRISGEYLYFRAVEEGLDYVITTLEIPSENTPASTPIIGNISNIQPSFKPGYRLQADYILPRDNGEISANWMRYHFHTTAPMINTISSSPQLYIWDLFASQNCYPYSETAISRWNLKMDRVDLMYSMPLPVTSSFKINPFIGIRGAWTRQAVICQYGAVNFVGSSVTNQDILSYFTWNMNGYGPIGGLDATWSLWKNFNFFSRASASLLVTNAQNNINESFANRGQLNGPNGLQSDIVRKLWLNTPVFELNTGISYAHSWDSGALEIRLGWEESLWVSHNVMNSYTSAWDHGITRTAFKNLSLSGYTLKTSLSF